MTTMPLGPKHLLIYYSKKWEQKKTCQSTIIAFRNQFFLPKRHHGHGEIMAARILQKKSLVCQTKWDPHVTRPKQYTHILFKWVGTTVNMPSNINAHRKSLFQPKYSHGEFMAAHVSCMIISHVCQTKSDHYDSKWPKQLLILFKGVRTKVNMPFHY